jgi:hypothetical protein
MKKLITLLFFAGFLTTAFAQTGHKRGGNKDQTNGKGYQQGQTSGNSRDQINGYGRRGGSDRYGYGKTADRAKAHGHGGRQGNWGGHHGGYSRHDHHRFGNDHYRKNSHRGWFHKRNRRDRH